MFWRRVASQSGVEGEEFTEDYKEAWFTMNKLVEDQSMSWSGRESNRVFLNLGGVRFADISGLTGADFIEDGRACARLDWDEDGRQDLVLRSRNAPRLRMMLNRWPKPGNWLQLDLAGRSCNRDAIGAQVRVEAGGMRLRDTVRAGEGFLSMSSKRLHFGLGAAVAVDRVRVRWPGGTEETFTGVAPNARWLLVQGAGTAAPVGKSAVTALLGPPPAPAQASAKRDVTRVPLLSRLPMSALPLPGWDTPDRTLADFAGGMVLVNLFSTTCAACSEEFEMFKRRRSFLANAGLKIVPMLVEEGADPQTARAWLAERKFDNLAGVASPATLDAIAVALSDVLPRSDEIPLPASLLFDAQGQLCVIYAGEIQFRELSGDSMAIPRLQPDLLLDPRLVGGTLLVARVRNFDKLAKQFANAGLAQLAALAEQRAADVQAYLKGGQ
jgi:hypothetical protein